MRDPSCGSRVLPWYRFPRFESPPLLMRFILRAATKMYVRRPHPPSKRAEPDRIRLGSRDGIAGAAGQPVRNPAAIHGVQRQSPHTPSRWADTDNRRASETKFPPARAAEEKPSAYTRGRVPVSAIPGDSMPWILKRLESPLHLIRFSRRI